MTRLASLLPRASALGRDDRGVSTIELALIAPFLALLVMGLGDLSRGLSLKFDLEQAAHRTLERSMDGADTSTGELDYDYLVAEAAAAAGVDEDAVTLEKWLECDGERMGDFEDSCAAGEEIARYLGLEIESSVDPLFGYGPLGSSYADANADGSIPIFADASLRVQ